MTSDTTKQATFDAAASLTALSDRFSRAAQSMTRMVARLAISGDGTKVVTSIAKYVNAGMPEAEAVADIATILEGSQSAEWRERRAKQRERHNRKKLEWQLSVACDSNAPLPGLERETVLASARERRNVISAAIAACEHGRDGGEIFDALSRYLRGEYNIFTLAHALKRAGLSVQEPSVAPIPESGNVVPLRRAKP